MVTFRNNNNRRPTFRNNNRRPPFRRNDESSKFSNNDNFHRKAPGRNNHNASKLIEKYNDLAREALAQEDKILSENYYQHADHFTRVQNEQESNRISRINTTVTKSEIGKSVETEVKEENANKTVELKNEMQSQENKKDTKKDEKKTEENKSAVS